MAVVPGGRLMTGRRWLVAVLAGQLLRAWPGRAVRWPKAARCAEATSPVADSGADDPRWKMKGVATRAPASATAWDHLAWPPDRLAHC